MLLVLMLPGGASGQRTLPEGKVVGEFRDIAGVRELASRALIVADSTGVTLVAAAGVHRRLELGADVVDAAPLALRGDSTAVYDMAARQFIVLDATGVQRSTIPVVTDEKRNVIRRADAIQVDAAVSELRFQPTAARAGAPIEVVYRSPSVPGRARLLLRGAGLVRSHCSSFAARRAAGKHSSRL
ncbi:MAG: hypothetical protein ACREMA_03030 [Longimicrobiales bacterium]